MDLEKRAALLVSIMTAGAFFVSSIFYFAQLSPRMTGSEDKISEQSRRIDRIEESRQAGLQRLSRVEEAMSQFKDAAAQINAKLDRVLMRGR